MTRCCDWQPDPTVFGPCPHCRPSAPDHEVRFVRHWFETRDGRPTFAFLTQGASP